MGSRFRHLILKGFYVIHTPSTSLLGDPCCGAAEPRGSPPWGPRVPRPGRTDPRHTCTGLCAGTVCAQLRGTYVASLTWTAPGVSCAQARMLPAPSLHRAAKLTSARAFAALPGKWDICPEWRPHMPSCWSHSLSLSSCLPRKQREQRGSDPALGEHTVSKGSTLGEMAHGGPADPPLPTGRHPAALLHAGHHAVDRGDCQEYLQAGDQEGSTVPGRRPTTIPQAAPAQVLEHPRVRPSPPPRHPEPQFWATFGGLSKPAHRQTWGPRTIHSAQGAGVGGTLGAGWGVRDGMSGCWTQSCAGGPAH